MCEIPMQAVEIRFTVVSQRFIRFLVVARLCVLLPSFYIAAKNFLYSTQNFLSARSFFP
jgi:hypothetical protein